MQILRLDLAGTDGSLQCDLQQPVCGNCNKGKYVCGGYDRNMIVVHVDDSGRGTYKPSKSTMRVIPLPARPFHDMSHADIRAKDLNRTSFEFECISAFWDLYLPRSALTGSLMFNPDLPSAMGKWAEYTTHYVPRSEVLRCSILALSTSKLGRSRQDNYLIQRGLELYGRALSLLSTELKSPTNPKHFGILNSCRILALYEV